MAKFWRFGMGPGFRLPLPFDLLFSDVLLLPLPFELLGFPVTVKASVAAARSNEPSSAAELHPLQLHHHGSCRKVHLLVLVILCLIRDCAT